MPLKFQDGGSFVPHIRYKAQTSTWELSTENGLQPIQLPLTIFDLENLKTGWCVYEENTAPEWVIDPSIDKQNGRPDDGREWNHGFCVNLLLPKEYEPERLREFATTATGAKESLKNLYGQYEAQKASNPGKVPVVQFQGAVPLRIGKGNTTVPTLTIVKWVDRPAALDQQQGYSAPPQSPVQGGVAQPPYPPQAAATPVQPPAAQPAPPASNLLETDF